MLLASAAPKGVLICRDELAGWLLGMTIYNQSGRQFWLESYGGRPYRVERQKHPEPIEVPRLAVAVTGGTQPERLAEFFKEPDDGLMARFLWGWPEPLAFRMGMKAPRAGDAIEALDRLRLLELTPDVPGSRAAPMMVPLTPAARDMIEAFAQEMQLRQADAVGLMRSALGKARGHAARLALVLTLLGWCAPEGCREPPLAIEEASVFAACTLMRDYFLPMAERVYGDAACPVAERNAATLARWIKKTRATGVHVRSIQRIARLPGLREAAAIHAAAALLVEADWLRPPPRGGFQRRATENYPVNPFLWSADE